MTCILCYKEYYQDLCINNIYYDDLTMRRCRTTVPVYRQIQIQVHSYGNKIILILSCKGDSIVIKMDKLNTMRQNTNTNINMDIYKI